MNVESISHPSHTGAGWNREPTVHRIVFRIGSGILLRYVNILKMNGEVSC